MPETFEIDIDGEIFSVDIEEIDEGKLRATVSGTGFIVKLPEEAGSPPAPRRRSGGGGGFSPAQTDMVGGFGSGQIQNRFTPGNTFTGYRRGGY